MFKTLRLVIENGDHYSFKLRFQKFVQDRWYDVEPGEKITLRTQEEVQTFCDENVDLDECFILNLAKDRININLAEVAAAGRRYYW